MSVAHSIDQHNATCPPDERIVGRAEIRLFQGGVEIVSHVASFGNAANGASDVISNNKPD
jgi:hypothetical protein